MKRWISIFLILIISLVTIFFYQNCSRRMSQLEQNVHPELSTYVQSFTEQAQQFGLKIDTAHLTVQYSDHLFGRKEVVGYCYREPITSPNGDIIGLAPTILVKKEWWDKAYDYQKTDLLFHELGHCVLDRSHVEDTNLSAQITNNSLQPDKLSIMSPILLSTRLSRNNYEQVFGKLIEELFLNKRIIAEKLSINSFSAQSLNNLSASSELPQLESNPKFREFIQQEYFFSESNGCSQTNQ